MHIQGRFANALWPELAKARQGSGNLGTEILGEQILGQKEQRKSGFLQLRKNLSLNFLKLKNN